MNFSYLELGDQFIPPENIRKPDVFRGCRKETPGCHELNQLFINEFITQIKFKKTKY